MLVLSRRRGERLVIGRGPHAATVTILDGGRVRLGIDAGPGVPIRRAELGNHPPRRPATAHTSMPAGSGRRP